MESNQINEVEQFDLAQTAYLFNWVANASSALAGEPAYLAEFVYYCLEGIPNGAPNPFADKGLTPRGMLKVLKNALTGGDWVLEWGPGVFEFKPGTKGKADNTAYIVYSPSLKTHIVAIAGTNPHALLDWGVEDFEVGLKDRVAWESFAYDISKPPIALGKYHNDPTVQTISLGTAKGIHALGSQLVKYEQLGAGMSEASTLMEYFRTLTPEQREKETFLFTGHSLGGALSPTLARWAKEIMQVKNVMAMPTAGPTPGNTPYQNQWIGFFPKTPVPNARPENHVKYFNEDVWNQQDVVPHAWQYIYTSGENPVVPADSKYFNSHLLPPRIETPIGKMEPENLLDWESDLEYVAFLKLVQNCQKKGTEADMSRGNQSFNFPSQWPMETFAGNKIKWVPQPTGPYKLGKQQGGPCSPGLLNFLEAIGGIHVYGYGTAAFGIPFATFVRINAHDIE